MESEKRNLLKEVEIKKKVKRKKTHLAGMMPSLPSEFSRNGLRFSQGKPLCYIRRLFFQMPLVENDVAVAEKSEGRRRFSFVANLKYFAGPLTR